VLVSNYVSTDAVKEAVERLGVSTAASTLTDYLIFRRALVNHQAAAAQGTTVTTVTTGIRSEPFTTAIDEMASCASPAQRDSWRGAPYFSPFGYSRDQGRGFKGPKYPSNGPSDTVAGWQSRSSRPLDLVPDTSPKQYTIANRTVQELEEFFHVRRRGEHYSGRKPALLDTACWWFRFTDLSERFQQNPDDQELCDEFVADLQLDPTAVTALFEPLGAQES
jgi:hypothetical protein